MTYIDHAAIVPAALQDEANHLAMILGQSGADALTYAREWTDASGATVYFASWRATADFMARAGEIAAGAREGEIPARPAWDTEAVVDLAAAVGALTKVHQPAYTPTPDPETGEVQSLPDYIASAEPSEILFFVGVPPEAVVAAAGITAVSDPSEGE